MDIVERFRTEGDAVVSTREKRMIAAAPEYKNE